MPDGKKSETTLKYCIGQDWASVVIGFILILFVVATGYYGDAIFRIQTNEQQKAFLQLPHRTGIQHHIHPRGILGFVPVNESCIRSLHEKRLNK